MIRTREVKTKKRRQRVLSADFVHNLNASLAVQLVLDKRLLILARTSIREMAYGPLCSIII